MAAKDYSDLTREQLIELLKARDQRTRFGLVWEANEIERDRALNGDFVALDLVPELSCGPAPWRNLIIEGDNFDALRHLRMTFAGQVKCIYIDPPYNTGNRDFVYNDRFVDREDSWRHSKWCEFMFQRLMLARDLLTPDGAVIVARYSGKLAWKHIPNIIRDRERRKHPRTKNDRASLRCGGNLRSRFREAPAGRDKTACDRQEHGPTLPLRW